MQPLVTILVPTYNRAHFLRDALASALAQTHINLDVVVLDDHSSDRTPDVVEEFRADPRLRYVRNATNLGIIGNWKVGLAEVRGDFFCILHDDDTFEPQFIEVLVRPLIEDGTLTLSFSDHWVMSGDGQRSVMKSDEASQLFGRASLSGGKLENFKAAAILDMSIPIGATLFRTKTVRLDFLDERATTSIDAWLLYKCVKDGGQAFYVPQRLMNYRAHEGGMSSSMSLPSLKGHLFRYENILSDPDMKEMHSTVRASMLALQANASLALALNGDHTNALHVAKASLRHRINMRAMLAILVAYNKGYISKLILARREKKSAEKN